MADVQTVVSTINHYCEVGYANCDPEYYDKIVEELETLPQSEKRDGLIRLAKGGWNLTSKRFAFPHIQSYAKGLLEE